MIGEQLTRREYEVLALTLEGLSACDIAGRLGFQSRDTVYVYRCRIADKLGVSIDDRAAVRRRTLLRTLVDDPSQT